MSYTDVRLGYATVDQVTIPSLNRITNISMRIRARAFRYANIFIDARSESVRYKGTGFALFDSLVLGTPRSCR